MNALFDACNESVVVKTFDPTGLDWIDVEIKSGDVVEFNREGQVGTRKGVLVAIRDGLRPLEIALLNEAGTLSYTEAHVFRSTVCILRAWREGVRLGIPAPFIGEVLQFDPPGEKNLGWVEVARPDSIGRSVQFNSLALGWPSRNLRVGERVRCEMRPVGGSREWEWFIG